MKLLETHVAPTLHAKRIHFLLLCFIGGCLSILVGIVEYFVHGNHWGWPDEWVTGLLAVGLVACIVGVIGIRAVDRQAVTTLLVTEDPLGLQVKVTGPNGRFSLVAPLQWSHWQSVVSIGEYEKYVVENVKISDSRGQWLGFKEELNHQTEPTLFVDVREAQLPDHLQVYELKEIQRLINILPKAGTN